MQATQTKSDTISLSREKLSAFINQMFGGATVGREDDEHPLPPGPWDPVIRKVAIKVFGPQPEPWRSELQRLRMILATIATRHPEIYDVFGGDRFSDSELNPQPLPPRAVFVAAFTEEVIDRALLTQEIADAMDEPGEQRGIIIVGGKLSLLVDELCGNNFKVRIPFPRPRHDEGELLSGVELLAAGAVFERNAATVANEGLRQELRNAGAKLIETGIARM